MVFFNGVSILLRWIEIGRKRVGSPQREREGVVEGGKTWLEPSASDKT